MTYYTIKTSDGRYVTTVNGSSHSMHASWTSDKHKALLWATEEQVRYAFNGIANWLIRQKVQFELTIEVWEVTESTLHMLTREYWDHMVMLAEQKQP